MTRAAFTENPTRRAERAGFSVHGAAPMLFVEGPGNDGRGIFNRWYDTRAAAWSAIVRRARRDGLI